MYAMVTQAAALIPPESDNISTLKPNKKAINTKRVRLLITGNSKMNMIYTYGLTYPKKLI